MDEIFSTHPGLNPAMHVSDITGKEPAVIPPLFTSRLDFVML